MIKVDTSQMSGAIKTQSVSYAGNVADKYAPLYQSVPRVSNHFKTDSNILVADQNVLPPNSGRYGKSGFSVDANKRKEAPKNQNLIEIEMTEKQATI